VSQPAPFDSAPSGPVAEMAALAEEFAAAQRRARARRVEALDALAAGRDEARAKGRAYHEGVLRVVRFVVPEGASVLDIGCSTGDLLAALRPRRGVGLDISMKAVEIARAKHPDLEFVVGDVEALSLDEKFDYVVMSDVVGMLDDVWAAFRALHRVCHADTRVVVTYYSRLWEPAIKLAEALGLKSRGLEQNWLSMDDLDNLLDLAHFEVVRRGTALLCPVRIPLLAAVLNRHVVRLPIVRGLGLVAFFVARPQPLAERTRREGTVTVLVPCRNERGNIRPLVARVPEMGRGTDILFVDGHSEDGTVEEIERCLALRPNMRLLHQIGRGKGDAVRLGFSQASGDVLMILDADLTVPPEDLPRFYDAIAEGKAEFVNGSRLVYPMEGQAMRFLNLCGNKFFSMAFSAILEQRLKDTLCGTKVLRRESYARIAAGRAFFGDFDPFGDFDLLFGAAKQNLRIVDMPVRYRARTYGETKIDRFREGWLLLRMTWLAFRKFLGAR
jgi:SAM-dependent methyltransferase